MSYRVKDFRFHRKKRKYGNTIVKKNGERYDSKFEKKVSDDLDWRVKAGELTGYDRQVVIRLLAYGEHICDYRIDFVAHHKDGITEYIEAKGFPTREWRIKWLLFCAQMKATEPASILTIITPNGKKVI